MKKELVTIIIPYYKKKLFFKQSYKSAIQQTYPHIEIIVIYDDTYEELDFVKNIIGKNINTKLIINKKNKGVSFSRNIGIQRSYGKYIAFLDSDDTWKKNKLEKQINFMKKNNFHISHTAYNYINEKNKIVGEFVLKKKLNYSALLNSCDIGLSTLVIEKKYLKHYPFVNITSKEDYVLWLKLIKKLEFGYLPIKLGSWRKLKNSLSGNFFKKIFNAFLVYYKYEKFNFIYSIIRVIILSYQSLKK